MVRAGQNRKEDSMTPRPPTSRPVSSPLHAGFPLRRRYLGAVAIALLAVATGCEADDESLSADACDRYADLQAAFFGDPAQIGPAVDAFADALPDEYSADAEAVATALSSDDPAAMGSPEYVEASDRIGDTVFADCDTSAAIDVSGVDYGFGGLPESVEAGRVALRLANESDTDQPHEVLIAVGAEGQSADELRDLPLEELMGAARPIGVAFTEVAGSSATTLVDLEPGSYLLICTLPVAENGEMPEGEEPVPTHADHGMVATLTVT